MDKIALPEYDAVPLDHIAAGLTGLRILFVNVYALSCAEGWTLIDAGVPHSSGRIKSWAEKQFGEGTHPQSIILTHGHFDHVGAIEDLLKDWDVPVYAHSLEMPYLTGRSKYPPPAPEAGGGLMAVMSPLYPRGPIDISSHVHTLPADHSLPGQPGWKWMHTPGHTNGHVSFFREEDRALLVGDAFCTTKAESLLAVATQPTELHGPPSYYTPDWDAAQKSVEELAALRPRTLAPGHGLPLSGDDVPQAVELLATNFISIAVPAAFRKNGSRTA